MTTLKYVDRILHDQLCTTSCRHQSWQEATISSPTTATALPSSSATSSVIDTANNNEVVKARGGSTIMRDQDSFRTAMFFSCWTCS
uniref:Uncharacterized protein n=1 Tax=Chenopodium quinoa TaxID=63459 RepID=A0A803LL61_CHEQI